MIIRDGKLVSLHNVWTDEAAVDGFFLRLTADPRPGLAPMYSSQSPTQVAAAGGGRWALRGLS